MSIKLIAVDIDGTLVNSKRKSPGSLFCHPRCQRSWCQSRDCNGSSYRRRCQILDDLQLRDEGDYVVTFNGALVQETATGHEIISESLTYEDYLDMEFSVAKLGVHMHAITKDGIYTANRNIGKYTVHESTLVNMPIFYRTPEEMTDKEIVKCMFIDEPEILDVAIEKIPAEFYERYSINKSAPFYLELLKKNVDKGSAITHLAEKLGLTKDETMAIGDEEMTVPCSKSLATPLLWKMETRTQKIAKYITKTMTNLA